MDALSPPQLGPRTFVLFSGALVFAGSVVVGARLWFDTLQRVWPTSDATVEGLQFGSFLIVVGALLVW